MGNLIFNGISTLDMGVQIQAPPTYEFPNRQYETISLGGRNGNFIIDKKTFSNVIRKYILIKAYNKNEDLILVGNQITNWLMSAKGYARLEDSYEPNYYRLALFEDSGEMQDMVNMATGLQISFNCKPQRYLKIGEQKKIISVLDQWIKITNTTKYDAFPEITLNGIGLTVTFVNGEDHNNPKNQSSFISSYENEFIIDSEIQECFNGSEYVNNKISLINEFPKLYPGTNWIKIEGSSLSKFELKPRWWTL